MIRRARNYDRNTDKRKHEPHEAIFATFYTLFSIKMSNSINLATIDGCIVWNAHNTVFGSKRPAICALAVYYLHSTR